MKRLERSIEKKEKEIEREKTKIAHLQQKLDAGKITRGEFNIKKKHIEEKIRAMDSRIRVLQGGMAREKRHQEEREEEKKKKSEKKEKKKEKKKKKKEK